MTVWTWRALRHFDASSFDKLASEQVMIAKIEKIARTCNKLKKAHVVEPFNGPALLSGRAAAVFFHEVVGHRPGRPAAAWRKRRPDVYQDDWPAGVAFILSVEDDPTLHTLEGVELSGNYNFDEEGEKTNELS